MKNTDTCVPCSCRVRFELPDGRRRDKRQIAQRPVRGVLGPFGEIHQYRCVVFEKAQLPLHGIFQPAFAEVVITSFCQSGGKRLRQNLLKERDVFSDELLLQVDGMCADQHLSLLLQCLVNRAGQVRKAFADTRARFHGQVKTFPHGRLDMPCHFKLFRTGFKVRPLTGDKPVRSQQFFGVQPSLTCKCDHYGWVRLSGMMTFFKMETALLSGIFSSALTMASLACSGLPS